MRRCAPLGRRILNRCELLTSQQYCSTCSEKVNSPVNLLEYYDKIQKILTNKNALVDHLCSRVVCENEQMVAINKLPGLPMKAEKIADNDARIIEQVSLYQTLPELRDHFKCPELNLILPLPRNHSGIVIFGKSKSDVEQMGNDFATCYKFGHLYQHYQLICVGIPISQSSDLQHIFVQQEKDHTGKVHNVPVKSVSKTLRRKGEAMMGKFKLKLLSKRTGHVECGYVELSTNTNRWNCCELFMTENMSPILGDHLYCDRVAPLLGKMVPRVPDPGEKVQKLPNAMLKELGIGKDMMSKMPLHLHRSHVHILKFKGKTKSKSTAAKSTLTPSSSTQEPLTVSASLPEYLEEALQKLKLNKI